MCFYTPNELSRYRTDTFSTKEPKALEWFERYGGSGTLYDIGANVGLYSVYYSNLQPGTLYALEPSAMNLSLLAKNINITNLTSQIVIVPNPLTFSNQVAPFQLSMLAEGGSMAAFGVDDGQRLQSKFTYDTVGMGLDFMLEHRLIPNPPAMIKIDVDGIEHLILRGAMRTLRSPSLKTVLIEVNNSHTESATEVQHTLENAWFALMEHRHSDMSIGGSFEDTFNQIWARG